MHAWKNNLSESIIRYRRTAMASILGASIIATSACGSVPPQQNNTPPAPETSVTAPANPSETAKPTETVKPSSTAKPTVKSKEIKALESQGIEISDTVEIADGSYPSYEVKQGSKLATYNPSLQSGGVPEGWKKSDMDKAQHKASNFLMNTVLNNQTRTSYYSNIKSLEKTFEKEVAPEYREEFINSIQSNDETPLMKDIFEDPTGQYADYTLINDGKTPRIKNVDAKVIESQSWNGDNYFVFKGTYTLSAMNKKTKKPRDIDAKFEYGITIRKSGDGKFYIVGANGIEGLYENIN